MFWKGEEAEYNLIRILCTYIKLDKECAEALGILYKHFSENGKRLIKDAKEDYSFLTPLDLSNPMFKECARISDYVIGGYVVDLGKTKKFSYSLLGLRPDGKVKEHKHPRGVEIGIIVENELIYNGEIQGSGHLNISKNREPHYYVDPFSKDAKILSISIPPWKPENEVIIPISETGDGI